MIRIYIYLWWLIFSTNRTWIPSLWKSHYCSFLVAYCLTLKKKRERKREMMMNKYIYIRKYMRLNIFMYFLHRLANSSTPNCDCSCSMVSHLFSTIAFDLVLSCELTTWFWLALSSTTNWARVMLASRWHSMANVSFLLLCRLFGRTCPWAFCLCTASRRPSTSWLTLCHFCLALSALAVYSDTECASSCLECLAI